MVHVKTRNLNNKFNVRQVKFFPSDSALLTQGGMQELNVLENYLSPICFIVKNRYAMEDVST